MPPATFDYAIIGGGYIGLALAYSLARRKASVVLLEANAIGSGTSGASSGRAQVCESQPGPHLELALAGLTRLEELEEELDYDFEWRRLGNLMLIDQEAHWVWWQQRVAALQALGAAAAMLDPAALREAEPMVCTHRADGGATAERFLGAAWCLEGHLNPLKFCQAWATAAARHGAVLLPGTPVLGFARSGGRIRAARTPQGDFHAAAFVVAAGAWSGELLRQMGLHLPVQFAHAEAMVSEPLPPLLRNHVGLADFYETIHGQAQAVSVGVAQQASGALVVTEAVTQTPELHRRNSHWGLPGMAADLLGLFPGLAGVRIVRGWAAPSPFLPDEHPAIGWMPGLDNVFVATCFHLTISTVPVLAERMAALLVAGRPAPEQLQAGIPAAYDPGRFGGGATARTGMDGHGPARTDMDDTRPLTSDLRLSTSDPSLRSRTSLRSPSRLRAPNFDVVIDGQVVAARQGQTVAGLLLAAGQRAFRRSRQRREPRGLFCGIGLCYECLVTIDGISNVRACVTPVQTGMRIDTGDTGGES